MSEDISFLESMSQEMATTVIYGNTDTDPEKFLGFAPRYSSLSAENGGNILNAGGTGSDNTSIWLVAWGESTCHGIYPKGSMAGLKHEDKGQVTLEDSANGKYEGYRTHYQWKVGLTLRDWRYVVRIANIDISLLKADDGTVTNGADLIKLIIKAIHKIPSKKRGKLALYCNEDIFTYLDLQTLEQSNINIKYGADQHGLEIMKFRGIPIRKVDAILNAEEKVA